jgi:hypothetical protein
VLMRSREIGCRGVHGLDAVSYKSVSARKPTVVRTTQ